MPLARRLSTCSLWRPFGLAGDPHESTSMFACGNGTETECVSCWVLQLGEIESLLQCAIHFRAKCAKECNGAQRPREGKAAVGISAALGFEIKLGTKVAPRVGALGGRLPEPEALQHRGNVRRWGSIWC